MTTIVAIDTDEIANTEKHGAGLWFYVVPDEERDEKVKAFAALGFTPLIADPLVCSECGRVGTYGPDPDGFAICTDKRCGHAVSADDMQPDEGERIAFACWPAVLCVVFPAD